MRGAFIAFEGCEGSGKSTQIRLLSQYLQENNIPHIVTREPGGGEISEEIRKIILNGKFMQMSDECEALLYAAARVQHLKDTVEPALSRGEFVLCDRYIFSSFAYQGYGRGLSVDFLEKINEYALQKAMPDITLFLNISPKCAFERKHGADENDRMEQAGELFHQRVYRGYLQLLKCYPDAIAEVECLGSKLQTSQNILRILSRRGFIKEGNSIEPVL